MKSKLFQTLTLLAVLLLALPGTLVMAAAYPQPTYVDEAATPPILPPSIDGSIDDWDLANDFFANMYLAGGNTIVLAKLYTRYDCGSGYLYVLVLAEPDVVIQVLPSQLDAHFVKLNNAKKVDGNDSPPDGTMPDLAWVHDGSPIVGWEAATATIAPAFYTKFNVHTNVVDADLEPQTAAVTNRAIELFLDCTPPSAVELASFTAEVAGPAIQLAWETVSEVDTLGFNLYRATAADGPRTKINAALIESQLPGNPMGAAYSSLDAKAERGVTYYYWLEEVDASGVATLYGPVTATLKAYVKGLPGRTRPMPAPGMEITIRIP